jgi:hypothetical protein
LGVLKSVIDIDGPVESGYNTAEVVPTLAAQVNLNIVRLLKLPFPARGGTAGDSREAKVSGQPIDPILEKWATRIKFGIEPIAAVWNPLLRRFGALFGSRVLNLIRHVGLFFKSNPQGPRCCAPRFGMYG